MKFVKLPSGWFLNVASIREFQTKHPYRLNYLHGGHRLLEQAEAETLAKALLVPPKLEADPPERKTTRKRTKAQDPT